MWKHALIIVLLLIIMYQLWSLSKNCMPMKMGDHMSRMDPAENSHTFPQANCGNGSFQAYGGENMIAASTITGLSRGFNAAPAGVGGYYDAITTLNDAEHANLASINPELYSR